MKFKPVLTRKHFMFTTYICAYCRTEYQTEADAIECPCPTKVRRSRSAKKTKPPAPEKVKRWRKRLSK